jgi:hypothetical protein
MVAVTVPFFTFTKTFLGAKIAINKSGSVTLTMQGQFLDHPLEPQSSQATYPPEVIVAQEWTKRLEAYATAISQWVINDRGYGTIGRSQRVK